MFCCCTHAVVTHTLLNVCAVGLFLDHTMRAELPVEVAHRTELQPAKKQRLEPPNRTVSQWYNCMWIRTGAAVPTGRTRVPPRRRLRDLAVRVATCSMCHPWRPWRIPTATRRPRCRSTITVTALIHRGRGGAATGQLRGRMPRRKGLTECRQWRKVYSVGTAAPQLRCAHRLSHAGQRHPLSAVVVEV